MLYMKLRGRAKNGVSLLEAVIGVLIVFIAVSSLSALFIDLSRVTGKATTTKQMAHLAKAVIDATIESAYNTTGYNNISNVPWNNAANPVPIVQGFDQSFLSSVQYQQQVSTRDMNMDNIGVEAFKKVQLDFTGPYNISFTTTFLVPKP